MTGRPTIAHHIRCLLALAAIATFWPLGASAQDDRERTALHAGSDHGAPPAGLVSLVRSSTERFRDVSVAEAEGYGLLFGCVSGPDLGAMGMHYVNLGLVGDGAIDPAKPEIVIYEPLPGGRRRLIGADYLVFAADWHATHQETPQIMGQLMHLFESPNRFGLPAFYTLHVWAWKDNQNGTFVNWHPKVSCDAYGGPNPWRTAGTNGGYDPTGGQPRPRRCRLTGGMAGSDPRTRRAVRARHSSQETQQ